MYLNGRARCEAHQANSVDRALEARKDFLKVGAGIEERRIGELGTRGIGVDHHYRVLGATGAMQRDNRPGPLVVLFHEVINPLGLLETGKVSLQSRRIKAQRQFGAVHGC